MDIATLQSKLHALGFYLGRIDGIDGPHTKQAVMDFQLHMPEYGLKVDSIAGPLTQAALLKAVPNLVLNPKPISQISPVIIINGLDVSHHQLDIEWLQVKIAGYAFVSIKASEGLRGIDEKFSFNWQRSKMTGMIRSAYHFFHPSMNGTAQANHFLNVIGDDIGELPCALDWEVHEGTSHDELEQGLRWLDKVKAATGKAPFLYTYGSYFEKLGSPNWLAEYPLWIAGYGKKPACPKPWTSYSFWQNHGDSTIPVPGISNTVKKDFDVFFGTIDDLRNFGVPVKVKVEAT